MSPEARTWLMLWELRGRTATLEMLLRVPEEAFAYKRQVVEKSDGSACLAWFAFSAKINQHLFVVAQATQEEQPWEVYHIHLNERGYSTGHGKWRKNYPTLVLALDALKQRRTTCPVPALATETTGNSLRIEAGTEDNKGDADAIG